MKLLYCPRCGDVFKLTYDVRSCECGHVAGRYEPDGAHAVVNGNGVSLAIGNGSLEQAIRIASQIEHEFYPVMCWVRGHAGKSNPRTRVDPNLNARRRHAAA